MDDLTGKFKLLTDAELPNGLHGQIVQKLYWVRLVKYFYLGFTLLGVGLGFSLALAWTKLGESGALTILQVFAESFRLDLTYLGDLANAIYELFPLFSLTIFTTNLLLFITLIFVFKHYKKVPIVGRASLNQPN